MIPTVDDLGTCPMVHRFGDLFNPPGLTNFLGCVQADLDLSGIRSLNFPPFACSDTVTGSLYLNDRLFVSTGRPITFIWYPDRIERQGEHDGIHIRSTTVLAVGRMAAIVRIRIENRGPKRDISIKLGLRGGITKSVAPWTNAFPPTESDNRIQIDAERGALLFWARNSAACMIQGCAQRPARVTPSGLSFTFTLGPGESHTLAYVNAVAETAAEAAGLFDSIVSNIDAEIDRARDEWNAELRAVFTPGNDRYSGHMPLLETSDRDILRLYHTGILGVIYFKRDTPFSVYGRAYTTLLPRYWQPVTFIWDYSLSSLVHALLDPAVMRKYLELWMHLDIHKHFGTEFLTGAGVGPWYSVNDFAMTTIARDYLRWTGQRAWLDQHLSEPRVIDFLEKYAHSWRDFRTSSGLADYGELNNLLECVGSYVHEVASLNAANVFNLRTVAEIFQMRGEQDRAAALRAEAAELARQVQKLYVPGKGYWNARRPDGSCVEVRHCYDFFTVINTIAEDLPSQQIDEMVAFFRRELQTPTWMHALSCGDDDATFSVRPDHQWTGAYTAWPAQAAMALYRVGQVDLAFDWLKGLARSANQGPFGQAHFVEAIVEPESGGARKASADFPYINDWACSSGGAWAQLIIESIFGVNATLNRGISALPRFGRFDPNAVLRNLSYQGKLYEVTRRGLRAAD
ncbi:MGH1-like glycoside hydrolase domain-containing protein [Fontivita pretiosa]|uniref:MGH1-like glycoside hydrolase domain-containing protein n=1 Tax=Fontivita pretiosa TaxID=2989684 RepID=UPI003D17AAA6